MRALVGLPVLALLACAPARVAPPAADPAATAVEAGRPVSLRVDHAWVRDAPREKGQVARRKAIAALRERVVAGASFNAAWEALHVAPAPWHVGEAESYPADVLPEGARNLPVGAVSPVLPGNGGLHLFRILGREARSLSG